MEALKLAPACKSYLWGGNRLKKQFAKGDGGEPLAESWELSVHPDGPSRIACGKYTGRTLSEYLAAHPGALGQAKELPILVKLIDAADRLSVQVHPSDSFAQEVEHDNGKTEMWYIVDALPGSGICCGLKRDSSAEEVARLTQEGRIEELLNFIPVRAGDCYLIEAGTLHAIGAGCLICEVQQSSNVTYRVYDYGRRDSLGRMRELHLEKALQVIDYRAFTDRTGSGAWSQRPGASLRRLTECPYFVCYRVVTDAVWQTQANDSFLGVTVLSGRGAVCGLPCWEGDSFLIPAGVRLQAAGGLELLISALPGTEI